MLCKYTLSPSKAPIFGVIQHPTGIVYSYALVCVLFWPGCVPCTQVGGLTKHHLYELTSAETGHPVVPYSITTWVSDAWDFAHLSDRLKGLPRLHGRAIKAEKPRVSNVRPFSGVPPLSCLDTKGVWRDGRVSVEHLLVISPLFSHCPPHRRTRYKNRAPWGPWEILSALETTQPNRAGTGRSATMALRLGESLWINLWPVTCPQTGDQRASPAHNSLTSREKLKVTARWPSRDGVKGSSGVPRGKRVAPFPG